MRRLASSLLLGIGTLAAGCDQPLEIDRQPPAAIADLSVDSPISTTLRLSWTSTGDDGTSGAASLYEIRFSTSDLLDPEALDGATALFLQVSQPGKARYSISVGNLERGRIYYFRIRAADEVLNWSPWSNVASGPSTNVPPEARFEVRNAAAVGETLEVDARASRDVESEALDLRWDWDGDGTWDTAWSEERVARHVIARPGSYPVRLEVRDEAGATSVAERAIGVAGYVCLSRASEASARVRGDCCVRPPYGCRRCDYVYRDTTAACDLGRLEGSAQFENGDAHAVQQFEHGLDFLRVNSQLSAREDGTLSGARSDFTMTIDVPGPLRYTLQLGWNQTSGAGSVVWSVTLSHAGGDTVTVMEGTTSPTPGLRIETVSLDAGIYSLAAIVDASHTVAVGTTFELRLGADLPAEEARR